MAAGIVAKMKYSLHKRGVWGTLQHLWGKLTRPLLALTPAQRRGRRLKELADQAYDAQFGVDTGGIIPLDGLGIDSKHQNQGEWYIASDPEKFGELMALLGSLPYEQYTFIDFGSGKGRALLMASAYPFRRIIGVEFSPELHAIAQRNIHQYPSEKKKCSAIELVCQDALQYLLPQEPSLLYFYSPFGKEVMKPLIERIQSSLAAHPREMYVLYMSPKQDILWQQADFVEKIAGNSQFSIYRCRQLS